LATRVYETSEIELQDGTKVTLRPLSLKKLRQFMSEISKMDGKQSEEEVVGILLGAAALGIADSAPELAADKTKLEEVLDMPTMKYILKTCGGIDLDDPNLMTAAMVAGQNSI